MASNGRFHPCPALARFPVSITRVEATMRKTTMTAALVLLFGCGQAAAVEIDAGCDIRSDYDFHLSEKSVILLDKGASPHTVLIRQGRLFIDDRWVQVSAADARRLVERLAAA
jgi:hypothetical protein